MKFYVEESNYGGWGWSETNKPRECATVINIHLTEHLITVCDRVRIK